MKPVGVLLVFIPVLMCCLLVFGLRDVRTKTRTVAIAEVIIISEKRAASISTSERTGFFSGLEGLPAFFQDTQPDGFFTVDESGNLVVDRHTRDVFDYFFTAFGVESLDEIEARLRAYINFRLSDKANLQAQQLLSDYLELQTRMLAMSVPVIAPKASHESLAFHLQSIWDLRRSVLGEEVALAFFGEEEAYDRNALETLRFGRKSVNQNSPAVLRDKLIDESNASRLAALDHQRMQWQERINQWMQVRESLLNNAGYSDHDKRLQLDELRSLHFGEIELKRVRALERISER